MWRFRTGSPWRDLPAEFGPWQTVWKRHRRYAGDGTWDRVLAQLVAQADAAGELEGFGPAALSVGGNVTNVVVGDIEKAKIVLAAHYDTGVREVLPPLICPTRPATYMLYEALIPLLALAVSGAVVAPSTWAASQVEMAVSYAAVVV